ncbi:ABC transporter ATPase and permease [Corynebacterium suranareeae]|uniref:ABC transporter ATPase and permease n=1 Tax=Corynebacterium suranareeae TaxID=2506452 RepID=A0A160PS21_9CORY|nr:ABC transporter ATP-binding protein [Corynebacterium suranareeae]BAU96415.1 ABC transporter ATPase and permease [Corynebacterium suranareeae]
MRSLLRDIPAVGWLLTALIVARMVVITLVIIGFGLLIDAPSPTQSAPFWWVLAGAITAAALLWAEAVLPQRLRARTESVWRKQLARKNLGLSSTGHDDAHIITLATEATTKASTYTVLFLGPFFAAFLAPIAVIIVIGLALSWSIAGLLSIGLCIIPFVISWAQRMLKGAGAGYGRAAGQLAGVFLESVRTLGTTMMLNATGSRRRLIEHRAEKMRSQVMSLLYRNQLMILVTDGVFGIATTTVAVVLAVASYSTETLTLGQAIALVLLARLLIDPINRMGRTFYTGMAGKPSLIAINKALATPPAVTAAPSTNNSVLVDGDLNISNLTISRGDTEIINGISFAVSKGSHVAIVGPSGAGKSSLALALSGLLDFEGTISIGGHDCTMDDLRASISFVPQSPTLFSGTIASNIDLANTGVDSAEIHSLLLGDELPADLAVGETGKGVSGGQAARISIARGLMKNSRIVVFDEATAQLDYANAKQVRKSAKSLDCTLLEITHRPSEALDADIIVVLENGSITMIDTPEQVSAHNAFFRQAVLEEQH